MLYLVTGAAGHLGNVVVKTLCARGARVRALVLPREKGAAELPEAAQVYAGNVLDKASLARFFDVGDEAFSVIHCAGIVSIASGFLQRVYDVNVTGTQNVIDFARAGHARRLVYVSSVHAIPELPRGETIAETDRFDPELVHGCYAKTKAEATARVLEAVKGGLDACVVHPSGICGPYDYGAGNMTQLLIDYCRRRITAGISEGGYDFVDVRDVAAGIVACCDGGRRGEAYILSNRYYSVRSLLALFHEKTGLKPIRTFLPLWFANLTAPLSELYYKILRQAPIYTPYSLYTLTTNAAFSHAKADAELGYRCRPMAETVRDMYVWLKEQGRIPDGPARAGRRRVFARRSAPESTR